MYFLSEDDANNNDIYQLLTNPLDLNSPKTKAAYEKLRDSKL